MRAIKGGPCPATGAPEKASCCNKSHAFDFIHSVILQATWSHSFRLLTERMISTFFYLLPSAVASDSKGSRIFRVGLASGLWIWAVTVIHRDGQTESLDSVNECLQPTTALGVIIAPVQNCHSVLFLSKRLFCVGTNKLLRVKCSWWWWSRGARCPSWPFVFLMKTLLEFERFFTRKRGKEGLGAWGEFGWVSNLTFQIQNKSTILLTPAGAGPTSRKPLP
jgi:hypothetical protein